ncbi:MAG: superoxide dismutase family protein [Novosphingobium sp.]
MVSANKISALGMLLLPALLSACATSASKTPAALASATIVNATGAPAGSAVITQSKSGLVLTLKLSGLTPGVHGMHLHTTGNCEAPAFTTAGPHLNPHGKQHGTNNPQGSHLGDLPNITAGTDGKVEVSIALNAPASELEEFLIDTDGTAIVVHSSADDYLTDPSGNSGGRIACGALRRG